MATAPDQDQEMLAVVNRLSKKFLRQTKRREQIKKSDPHLYFYYCLGSAINKWATIDADFFTLFRFALNAKNDVKAAMIYYRAQQISEHFQMVDMLIRLELRKKQLRMWEQIVQEFNKLSPFRNRLAHDPINAVVVLRRPIKVAKEFAKMAVRHRLRPPAPRPADETSKTYYELNIADTKLLRALNKPVPPPIRVGDIQKHADDVANLQMMIVHFLSALPKRAVKRALRPISIPPRLESSPTSATTKKMTRKTARPRYQR